MPTCSDQERPCDAVQGREDTWLARRAALERGESPAEVCAQAGASGEQGPVLPVLSPHSPSPLSRTKGLPSVNWVSSSLVSGCSQAVNIPPPCHTHIWQGRCFPEGEGCGGFTISPGLSGWVTCCYRGQRNDLGSFPEGEALRLDHLGRGCFTPLPP